MTADLLTRLEAAKEGSRELDVEIATFAGIPYPDDPAGWPPQFTTSLDAITGLIERELPGWLHGYEGLDNGGFFGWVLNQNWPEYCEMTCSEQPTPALALCVAFVKAKEAQKGPDQK